MSNKQNIYYSEKNEAFFFVYEDLGDSVRGQENFNQDMATQGHYQLSKKYLQEEGYKFVGKFIGRDQEWDGKKRI